MEGEENEQMGVGEYLVCFDVDKEYGGEEDEVLWPHRPEERYEEQIDAREDGRQAEKGQTSNDLDLKEWTKLDIVGASQLANDREMWRKSTSDKAFHFICRLYNFLDIFEIPIFFIYPLIYPLKPPTISLIYSRVFLFYIFSQDHDTSQKKFTFGTLTLRNPKMPTKLSKLTI